MFICDKTEKIFSLFCSLPLTLYTICGILIVANKRISRIGEISRFMQLALFPLSCGYFFVKNKRRNVS